MKPHLPLFLTTMILAIFFVGLSTENLPAQKAGKHAKIKIVEIDKNGNKVIDTAIVFPSEKDLKELQQELQKLEGDNKLLDSLLKENDTDMDFDLDIEFAEDFERIFHDIFVLDEDMDDLKIKKIKVDGDWIIMNGDTLEMDKEFVMEWNEKDFLDHGDILIDKSIFNDDILKTSRIIIKEDCDPSQIHYEFRFNDTEDEEILEKNGRKILKLKLDDGISREVMIIDLIKEDEIVLKEKKVLDDSNSNDLQLEELQFFPNPNDGRFTVSFVNTSGKTASVSIYNLSGKEVFSDQSKNQVYENSIDISRFGSGTYFLKITIDDTSHTKKIILN